MMTRLEAMELEWNTSLGGEISYEGHSVKCSRVEALPSYGRTQDLLRGH